MLADMASNLEAARLLAWRAAWGFDAGETSPYFASISKVFGSEMAQKCAADAVQVTGIRYI